MVEDAIVDTRSRPSAGAQWRRGLAPLLALLSLTSACAGSGPAAPVQRTLVLALPPGTPPTGISAAAPVAAVLARATGLEVRLQVPASVESLGPDLKRGRIDAALLSDPAYLVVSAGAPVKVVAQAATDQPAPVLLCSTASGVGTLRDGATWTSLRGKSILLGPHGSLATNTWPRYFMARNGIDPLGDVGEVRIVADERRALLDVYNGIADCVAASSDGRASIADIAPDAGQRISVAFSAPVAVPPPPVVVRKGLAAALQRKLAAALASIQPGTPASAALGQVGGFATARPATDRDYAALRAVAGDQPLPS